MRLLCAMLVFGLVTATSTGEEKKAGKATVQVTGEFTADKDTTLGYTLKKGGKVVAEEKGLTALPGKTLDIDAADAAGPFDLRVHSTGNGVVTVKQIGVTVVADGKTSKGAFATAPWTLGAANPSGVVRAMTFPIVPVAVKTEEPKKEVKKEEPKKEIKKEEPKKEEPKKKEEVKKEEPKKTDEPKKEVKKEEPKKTDDEPKKSDEKKKEDSVVIAPAPRAK
ncbi:MAG: hypothetical protein K8U57_22395 [Planctomycetes bacterium]|nr:hypothetical protein [Planctomycetota bacterium]